MTAPDLERKIKRLKRSVAHWKRQHKDSTDYLRSVIKVWQARYYALKEKARV